jgi:hypothetical protein
MVLTNTYIRHRRTGFTIVEYLVALGIGLLCIATGVAISNNFMRSVAFLSNAMDLDAKSRLAVDRMSREIRQCDAVDSAGTNQLVLRMGTNLITFEYVPATRQLVRADPARGTEVYLKGCDYIRFDLFRRNPMTPSYRPTDTYPIGTAASCKMIQINWVCSRRLLGFPANKGRMESARVVIRNQQGL